LEIRQSEYFNPYTTHRFQTQNMVVWPLTFQCSERVFCVCGVFIFQPILIFLLYVCYKILFV